MFRRTAFVAVLALLMIPNYANAEDVRIGDPTCALEWEQHCGETLPVRRARRLSDS
jgi:hypothetical protein